MRAVTISLAELLRINTVYDNMVFAIYQAKFPRAPNIYGEWIVSKVPVTVLEEGDFTEEGGGFNWKGCFSVGGYHYLWRRGAF